MALGMKVKKAYKTELNKAEIRRLLGNPRTTFVIIIKKKLKVMEVWKTCVDLGESRRSLCAINFQES